jgi:predicted MFS family arabinose efflux permease
LIPFAKLSTQLKPASIRARKLHAVSCIFSSFFIALFWFIPGNYAMAMLFCGLLGQATGLQVSLPVNDIQEILGPERVDRFGQYSGMTYLFASPFILTGPMITGLLVDRFGINVVAYWAITGFCASAVFLMVSLRADDVEKIDDDADKRRV